MMRHVSKPPPTPEIEAEIEDHQRSLFDAADQIVHAAGKVAAARERFRKKRLSDDDIPAVKRERTASGKFVPVKV